MELALATNKAKTHRALAEALRQLLLLIALAYAIAHIVSACFSLMVKEESRSSTLFQGSSFNLRAELFCDTASTRLWERSECNLPK